jgi:hypothetical protein
MQLVKNRQMPFKHLARLEEQQQQRRRKYAWEWNGNTHPTTTSWRQTSHRKQSKGLGFRVARKLMEKKKTNLQWNDLLQTDVNSEYPCWKVKRMQEKHKSVDDFAASNKTSSLCHKTIQPELTCETESHKTKMSLKPMKANTEAKLHHANLFSKLSLSHYSSHWEKCKYLSESTR